MRIPPKYFRSRSSDACSPQHNRYMLTMLLMTSFFLAGVAFAIAHHVFYTKLHDSLAGSASKQQWPIRFGTAFAFATQVCFVNSASTAFAQWIWRQCRQKATQIRIIDAAFMVDRNVFMLFNPKFISGFPIPAAVALVFWCLPLSSLIAPTTLGVEPKPNTTVFTVPVTRPSVDSFEKKHSEMYSDSQPRLDTMINTVALTGERLPFAAPGNLQNISYNLPLTIPLVRCHESNETVRSLMAASALRDAVVRINRDNEGSLFREDDFRMHRQNLTFTSKRLVSNDSSKPGEYIGRVGYYAFPAYISEDDSWAPGSFFELWVAMINPPQGSSQFDISTYDARYYTCALTNATLTAEVTFTDSSQFLHVNDIRETKYTISDWASAVADPSLIYNKTFADFSYFAVALTLFNSLTGLEMIAHFPESGPKSYRNTTIYRTVLGKSNEYVKMRAAMVQMARVAGGSEYDPSFTMSSLPIETNQSITTLIEELALNVSLSLMAIPSLSSQFPVAVNQTLWVNEYTYHPKNLFIAYGLSTLATFIALLSGIYAAYTNGEGYDTHFSTISSAMQSPDVVALFRPKSTNTPVPKKMVAKSTIQLERDNGFEQFRTKTEFVAMDPA